jgi:hypothetical protein
VVSVWVVAGAVPLAAASWEAFWRRRGFVPWVRDDWPAWSAVRRSDLLKGPDAVALIGASRLQVGLVPGILARLTGRRPAMLAVDGSSPLAALGDLAADLAFNGTIICSLTSAALAEPEAAEGRSAKWIRKSRSISPSRLLIWRLWLALQGRLVCLAPDLTVGQLLGALKSATWPMPHRAPMSLDRSRALDYSKVDIDALRRARERRQQAVSAAARPLPPERFDERLARIAGWVDAIRSRGGRVVFLRMPSSGAVRDLERGTWPRSLYWDRLAAAVGARSIHYEDHPRLAEFKCPDGSHLGAEDARRFSRELLEVLREGGNRQGDGL